MTVHYADDSVALHVGDALEVLHTLPNASVDCIVTSPPYYGLRNYGHPDQYGLEPTPVAYVERLRDVFREAHRVLADDGVLWLNLGDSYSGKANGGEAFDRHRGSGHRSKAGIMPPRINNSAAAPYKSLLLIPARVALALVDDGWVLRNDVVWHKPNAMPESVTDRLSSRFEHVFLFSKSPRYSFDLDAIREPHAQASIERAMPHRAAPGRSAREGLPYGGVAAAQTLRVDQMNHPLGRNPGDVWTIATQPFAGAHFACMPSELARRCVAAGCKPGGTVLDPFSGSGTTGAAAAALGRRYVGIDIRAEYHDLALASRLAQPALLEPPATRDGAA